MEVTNTMGAAELLRKYLAEADPDLLRSMVQSFAEALMSAEASGVVEGYVTSFTDERDDQGRRLVVRNGHAVTRSLVTGAGPIEVRAPRVDDRRVDEVTGEKMPLLDPAALGPQVPESG